jgi:hypothetical protein
MVPARLDGHRELPGRGPENPNPILARSKPNRLAAHDSRAGHSSRPYDLERELKRGAHRLGQLRRGVRLDVPAVSGPRPLLEGLTKQLLLDSEAHDVHPDVDPRRLPWIALVLALSFAFYGLIRKLAPLGALEGLTLETLLIAPVVVPALAWWTLRGSGAMGQGDLALDGWLLLSGPLTALPLLLFAAGARRLPLATIGLLQYLSPTISLGLGIWVFGEPFGRTRAIGFGLIWAALALYWLEGRWRARWPVNA